MLGTQRRKKPPVGIQFEKNERHLHADGGVIALCKAVIDLSELLKICVDTMKLLQFVKRVRINFSPTCVCGTAQVDGRWSTRTAIDLETYAVKHRTVGDTDELGWVTLFAALHEASKRQPHRDFSIVVGEKFFIARNGDITLVPIKHALTKTARAIYYARAEDLPP